MPRSRECSPSWFTRKASKANSYSKNGSGFSGSLWEEPLLRGKPLTRHPLRPYLSRVGDEFPVVLSRAYLYALLMKMLATESLFPRVELQYLHLIATRATERAAQRAGIGRILERPEHQDCIEPDFFGWYPKHGPRRSGSPCKFAQNFPPTTSAPSKSSPTGPDTSSKTCIRLIPATVACPWRSTARLAGRSYRLTRRYDSEPPQRPRPFCGSGNPVIAYASPPGYRQLDELTPTKRI